MKWMIERKSDVLVCGLLVVELSLMSSLSWKLIDGDLHLVEVKRSSKHFSRRFGRGFWPKQKPLSQLGSKEVEYCESRWWNLNLYFEDLVEAVL
jgi:hypothetical protein